MISRLRFWCIILDLCAARRGGGYFDENILLISARMPPARGQHGIECIRSVAWRNRWSDRIAAAQATSLASDKPRTMTGVVEGDETFILESFKGRRSDMPRKPRKRGGKSAKRGLSAEQIPAIVARDREGSTTDAVLPRLNRVSIAAADAEAERIATTQTGGDAPCPNPLSP